MFKKILIGFGIFAMSVLCYLNFGSMIYASEELKYVENAIVNEDYAEAYKIVGSTFNEVDYKKQQIDGMTLTQFNAISAGVKDADVEDKEFQYIEIYEGAEFALYNIDKDLNFSAVNKVVAYRNNVATEMTILASFLYSELDAFAFSVNSKELPYIDRIEFLESKVITQADEENDIEEELEETIILSIELENSSVGFTNTEVELWSEYIVKYNKFDYDYRESGTYDSEEYDLLIEELQQILEDSDFCQRDYSTKIAEVTSFRVKITVLLVSIGLVDTVLILFFIIRSRKNKPVVSYQQARQIDKTKATTTKTIPVKKESDIIEIEDKSTIEKKVDEEIKENISESSTKEDVSEDKTEEK